MGRRPRPRLLVAAVAAVAGLVVAAPPAHAQPGVSTLIYDGELVMTVSGSGWVPIHEDGQLGGKVRFSAYADVDADGFLTRDTYSSPISPDEAADGSLQRTQELSPTGRWYVQVVITYDEPLAACGGRLRCASNVASVRNVVPNSRRPSTSLRGEGLIATDRRAGTTRYETAREIAQLWANPPVVYLATGEGFADALAAGPAAAYELAPILLAQRDALPEATAEELQRLAPQRVVLVGGTAAISEEVERTVDLMVPEVERVAGANRYLTAAALVARVFGDGILTAYIASGRAFADPIVTGAAAAIAGAPLLLVDGTVALEEEVREQLERLEVTNIVAVGPDQDLAAALDELRAIAPVERIDQDDLFERSAALWDDVDPPVYEVLLATSRSFADALAGTPYAAIDPYGYLMLSERDCIPAPVAAQIDRLNPDYILLLGGEAALGPGVQSRTPC